MTESVDVRQLVVTAITRLEQIHRAGLQPSFGQVEDLFDLGRRLEFAIQVTPPTLPCALPGGCSSPATEAVGKGRYCTKHAQALRALTALVEGDVANIALARLADMEHGRAPWPAALAQTAASPESVGAR